MRIKELKKRDLKKNPLMVVDPSLDRFKNTPIPQYKIDSANDVINANNFKELATGLKNKE